MREAQGEGEASFWSAQVAGLEGHVSRSAVYLVHKAWAGAVQMNGG
jgi:hypothetical protein